MSTTMFGHAATAWGRRPLNITDADFKANPLPIYRYLRETHPVSRVKIGLLEGWMLTRYDDVLAFLKDDRFIKSPRALKAGDAAKNPWLPATLRGLERTMLNLDDPDHARLRGLVHKAFTPARITQLEGRIQHMADELLAAMVRRAAAGQEVDLVRDFALPLPLTVIVELLGVPRADMALFTRWTRVLLQPLTRLSIVRLMPTVMAFSRYVRRHLNLRRLDPRDDLLTALVQAEDAGDRLSEDEAMSMVFLLLVAGHETTANLIASGILALLEHPDQLAALREQPALAKPAIEELLRFVNPVEQSTERYASEDVVIAGQAIRRGDMVLGCLAAANRDGRAFARPDVLDLTREHNRHLAFGQGSHFCLGAPLARLEGQIAIPAVLRRLPELRLAVPADRLRWRATPLVRGLEALPIAF